MSNAVRRLIEAVARKGGTYGDESAAALAYSAGVELDGLELRSLALDGHRRVIDSHERRLGEHGRADAELLEAYRRWNEYDGDANDGWTALADELERWAEGKK